MLKIRQWKLGLIKIIGEKVFNELGIQDDKILSKLSQFGIKLVSYIFESVDGLKDKLNLQPTQRRLLDNFLDSKKIIVFIDDLDRGWEGKKDDITRISALLNAVRDLSTDNPGLYFKISLRTDVYFLVRTSDESTDKIGDSIVWIKWTIPEIYAMLIKRIASFYREKVDDKALKNYQKHSSFQLEPIFCKTFLGEGKWSNTPTYKVLMSMTRKRPRDLVKLCAAAARKAAEYKRTTIDTDHLKAVFEEYSHERLQDAVNEYKSELKGIENLLLGMRPNKKERKASLSFMYTTNELYDKLNNIKSQNTFTFSNGRFVDAKSLAQFLYKINFISAIKQDEQGKVIERKYFEENRYLSGDSADFGYGWEVHNAFRFTLQPSDVRDILRNMGLY